MKELDWLGISELETQHGNSLFDLSLSSPVMVVFLRHFGCTFCRRSMSELSKRRAAIEASGVRIVLVHLSPDEKAAESFFKRYKINDLDRLSDPECIVYRRFGLGKATFSQLFGLTAWTNTYQSAFVEGHIGGAIIGDGFQMPGMFVIQNGQVIEAFIHTEIYDQPDYEKFLNCCKVA